MKRRKCHWLVRLAFIGSLGIGSVGLLTGCEKTPTDPGDGGGDTTGTGKNVVEQIIGALS